MKVTDPVWDEEQGEWKVIIYWDGSAGEYFFAEESEAESFVRVQHVHVEEVNRRGQG